MAALQSSAFLNFVSMRALYLNGWSLLRLQVGARNDEYAAPVLLNYTSESKRFITY